MRRLLMAVRNSTMSGLMVALVVITSLAVPVAAEQFQATTGAQSGDLGRQALAFLPNELWIHTGDTVTWAFPTNEPHTVTFLKQDSVPNQARPPFPVGCPPPPGTTPSGTAYSPSQCLNSGILLGGTTYTVQFPTAGNFKLVCLLHNNMTGLVHVLNISQPLPYDQDAYDQQAHRQLSALLSDASGLQGRGVAIARASHNAVTAGIGEILATGGGTQTASVNRFLQGRIVVHVGETVEWTNLDPVTPHTVTFGTEPDNPQPPTADVTVDTDGGRRAVLAAPGGSTSSGFLIAESQDQIGLPQTQPGPTRFRVTFNSPGIFDYICALHDELGMTGRVIVVP